VKPTARQVAARQAKWDEEVAGKLPDLLRELLSSPSCATDPPRTHGVYLFSEGGTPLYVGRTGRTERSRLANKDGHSNFATRHRAHTRARHNEGTYAYRLAVEACREGGIALASTRAENCENPEFMEEFRRQCDRVSAMEFRVVEIGDDKLAAVFEVYAATVLGTGKLLGDELAA
jgi:hypothetical protein